MKIPFSHAIAPVLIMLIWSCNTSRDQKAVDLIRKSIQAHGGQESWEAMQVFSFDKKTLLYLEDGEIESQVEQQLEFRLKPYFEARISWEKDSILHRTVFDGLKTHYWMGDNEIQNEGFLQSKKKELDAAFYVLDKPFALLNDGLHVRYLGSQDLQDGRTMEAIQVIDGDPEDPKVDVWWYYFDPENFLLYAYKVKTGDHISMVYNLEFDEKTPVKFPGRRESYRVDSEGKHLYLRAEYYFTNYRLK